MVGVFYQTQRKFLALQEDCEATGLLLSVLLEGLAVLIQFLLVSSADISEPFSIRLNAANGWVIRSFLHFLNIWLFIVHVKSVNSGSSSELRALLAACRVRSMGVSGGLRVTHGRSFLA